MPQDRDGTIARRCKASSTAGSNSLIMRPADAAKRRPVALPPSRGTTAQDGAPDDDQLQVRKAAAFACGFWSGSRARHILRASSGQCEATLQGAVAEVVTLIIRIGTTLFRIVQGRPQPCDPPSRNDLEGCSVHLIPPLDRCSLYHAGAELASSRVSAQPLPGSSVACCGCGWPVTRSHQASARASNV